MNSCTADGDALSLPVARPDPQAARPESPRLAQATLEHPFIG